MTIPYAAGGLYDLYLTEIERSKGVASILRTKADIPAGPTPGKVKFFIDMEGTGAIQTNMPEPTFPGGAQAGAGPPVFPLGCPRHAVDP